MSVPTNAYGTKKLKAVKNLINYDTYLAKFLQNTTPTSDDDWGDGYFNSTDDDATKKSKILDIFKLDGFVRITGTSEDLFAGYTNEDSANSLYHNSNRLGVIKLQKDGINKFVYNDAGLNVRGEASIGTNILSYANLVLNNGIYKSSYYNTTTAFGFKYRVNSGTWVTAPNQDLSGVAPTALNPKELYNNPLVIYPPANKGDIFEIKSYITNSEGVIESNILTFALDDRIEQVDALYRTDPQDSSNEVSVDFWMLAEDFANLATLTDTGQTTGIYGHTSVFRTTPIASGWYVGILEDKALYVDSNGQFTYYTPLAPAQWILSCGIDVVSPDPETMEHGGISFSLNFNAPSDVLITGYVSETPAGQPQVGGFSFSSTMLQGTDNILNTQSEGFTYTGSEYYLIVTTPNHPHIQFTGDGQFI